MCDSLSYTPRSRCLSTQPQPQPQPQPHRRILSQISRSDRSLSVSRFSRYFYRFCPLFTARSLRRIRLAPSLRISEGRGLRRLPVNHRTTYTQYPTIILDYSINTYNYHPTRQHVDAIRSVLRHQEIPESAVLSRLVANTSTIKR